MTQRATLFDPTHEIDSCGIGFVADAGGRRSRTLVETVIEALNRVRHRGATVADVRLMRETVGRHIGVKASGGIRTLDDARTMIDAGANRIGASATVAILSALD